MRSLNVAFRVVAVAVLTAGFTHVRPPDAAAPGVLPEEVYAPNPERVALRINGWIIEVDPARPDAGQPAAAVAAASAKPSAPRQNVAVVRAKPRSALSRYDQLIQWHAATHGLDWRLVAALIQEESGFKSDAVSGKGAVGLMQVRAIAAEQVGEPYFDTPNDNIRTGVRYLEHLQAMFAPAGDGRDRLALVLAAYNMGPAHVQDAQVLARIYGFDPYRWENSMERIIPLLEDETFYRRLPSGYAQGRNGVTYVQRILNRYERFKAEAGETPGLAGPSPHAASANG